MSQLLPESRRARIVESLNANGTLRVTELSEQLGVAAVTIRRDINELAARGLIRRVHGGAAPIADATDAGPDRPTSGPQVTGLRLGMLVPSLDYYWPDVIQGAQREASRRGLVLGLRGTSYEATDDREQVTHLLRSGVDGLLLAPDVSLPETAELLRWLEDSGVPVVLVEREAQLPDTQNPVESASTDHMGGAMAAVHHLAELGHRRLGFVSKDKSPHLAQLRHGWCKAVADLGLVEGSEWHMPRMPARGDIDAWVDRFREEGTTALLVHADREAILVGQHYQRRGFLVGEDISIVAYDDEIAGLFTVPMTAVRPPRASLGQAAVALLAERLVDPDRPAHRVKVSPKLFVRESTAQKGTTRT